MSAPLQELRRIIQESIRVQRGGADPIDYVDVSSALRDVVTRQNHVIFGRRGCGKTLLLGAADKQVGDKVRVVYINLEDYKQHSFPNVIIEILDHLFRELERNLGGWFGRKKRSRELMAEIRKKLADLKTAADDQETKVKATSTSETRTKDHGGIAVKGLRIGTEEFSADMAAIEKEYRQNDSKIRDLNLLLPQLKERVREFFKLSTEVQCIFIELDDFYHLPRIMQPHVTDFIHRLCKDLPLFFKIATLRHASVLFADRGGQPTGAQERHDYQPITVDFTLANFTRTRQQLREILDRYGAKAGMSTSDISGLFRGEGFDRLVLASGGVPRDFLSLLLEALSPKAPDEEKVGKDDVRLLSLAVFPRRIEELKADSEQRDQDPLLRGIYAIRKFCLDKKVNVFLVSEQVLQSQNGIRELINRLLDYRIVHSLGSALTHKSVSGTYSAYMIDIGAYANYRKLEDRFSEIDVTAADARERCRNAPVIDEGTLIDLYRAAPADPERALAEPEQ